MKYTIIRDTREKNGWWFPESAVCDGTVVEKLDTGDYTLKDKKNILCIERKGSIGEFANNITQKRFENELERMREYKFSFVLLEFDLFEIMSFPQSANFPARVLSKIKITAPFVLKKLIEYEMCYPTKFILCGQYGINIANNIFKRVME